MRVSEQAVRNALEEAKSVARRRALVTPEGMRIPVGGQPRVREIGDAINRHVQRIGQETREASGAGARETPKKPGGVEHKTERWAQYLERGGNLTYEKWSKKYDIAIQNSRGPLLREAVYRSVLGGENRVLPTDRGGRQVDIFIAEQNRAIQLKTGYEYLTTSGRLNNLDAIARDRLLIMAGYKVEWVLEKGGSEPLLAELKKAGIKVHIGPLIP